MLILSARNRQTSSLNVLKLGNRSLHTIQHPIMKEIHAGDYSITKWSDWEAVFTYEGDGIAGGIHRLQGKES